MNDYVRFSICTAAGAVLGLAIFRLVRRSKVDVRRFGPMSLGGAAAGAFAGMLMAGFRDFEAMPLSHWWMPLSFATLMAVLLQQALADTFKMAEDRKG